jgi:nucleotide-binding universal stress UspA family protein
MSIEYRILVAIDLETGTDRLLAEVQRYSKALDAIVDIIHVAPHDPDFVGYIKSDDPKEQTQEDIIRKSKAEDLQTEYRKTQTIRASLQAKGVRVGQALTVQGPIFETILVRVRKLNSDLLILGSHQHSAIYRLWYGDTAINAVKKHTPWALLVVPVTS